MPLEKTPPPQWLTISWLKSVLAAGATASETEIATAGEALLEKWEAPERRYHNVKHLVDVLTRVDELAEEAHEPDLVRLAAWFHGAMFSAERRVAYAKQGGENEAASAQYAREVLTSLGVPTRNADRVAFLVTALVRHKPENGDSDCAVLCDADLAILASEPQKYIAYVENIRAEYAHIPPFDYLQARAAILSKLLAREKLFFSPLARNWDTAARQNLEAEKARLDKEIKSQLQENTE